MHEHHGRGRGLPISRRRLMSRQRIAVSQGDNVQARGQLHRRAAPQVADNRLDMGVAEKRKMAEGHEGNYRKWKPFTLSFLFCAPLSIFFGFPLNSFRPSRYDSI